MICEKCGKETMIITTPPFVCKHCGHTMLTGHISFLPSETPNSGVYLSMELQDLVEMADGSVLPRAYLEAEAKLRIEFGLPPEERNER